MAKTRDASECLGMPVDHVAQAIKPFAPIGLDIA